MNSTNTQNNFFELLINVIFEKNDNGIIVLASNKRVIQSNFSKAELEKILSVPRQSNEFEELLDFIIDRLVHSPDLVDELILNDRQLRAERIHTDRFKDKLIFEYASKLLSSKKETIVNVCDIPNFTNTDKTQKKFKEKINCYQTIVNTLSDCIGLKDEDSNCLPNDRSSEYFGDADEFNFFDGELETFLCNEDLQAINRDLSSTNEKLLLETDNIHQRSIQTKKINSHNVHRQQISVLDLESDISRNRESAEKL